MLDIQYIREHAKDVEDNSARRGVKVSVNELLHADEERRQLISEIETLRSERNKASKTKPTPEIIEEMRILGGTLKDKETRFQEIEHICLNLLKQIPNMTHPDVPDGGEGDAAVMFTHGSAPHAPFATDHESLLCSRGLLDFQRGAKVAGSKFSYQLDGMVRLNMALLNYAFDIVERHSYKLMETPDMVKDEILEGSGFNPRGEESQTYKIADHDLNLIGTAEISVLGYHADEILDLSEGPIKYAALSHSYRTEAGSYGRTQKGLYRVHQFTKLELFVFCAPADSGRLHEELLSIEREICDGLELSYQVIDTAAHDLGAPAYRKFDIEAWMTMLGTTENPGGYGEITSTSNCTDYQARRLNIRYKQADGATEYVHTLNGTAMVLSRFPLTLVEQHQQEDGSISIPKSLIPYFGKDRL